MFGKPGEAIRSDHKEGHSVLQRGVTVRGDFESGGDVRLDGRLEGKVIVSETLTIGEGGTVVASVEAGEVIVMGTIHGNVRAHRRLEIRKGATVIGDLTTPVLVIEDGVRFQGHSNMEEGQSRAILRLHEAVDQEPPLKLDSIAAIDARS
jgi:cytoskeletal protein CcmA (bactofilin family)